MVYPLTPGLGNQVRHLMFSFLRMLFLLLGVASVSAMPALSLDSHSPAIQRTSDGVILHSSAGTLRIAVCSERVIHVVASPTDTMPEPKVPVVIRPCKGASFAVFSDPATVSIKTAELRIEIDRATHSLRFLTASGQKVLSEQPHDGRSIVPANFSGMQTYKIRQDFLLSPDEALYGLGQHQEGLFNLRSIPVRLVQANTNISIPFLVSTEGYGLLWNNAALTDFNPANEVISLDGNGVGTFRTGPEGEYGFLLGGNERDKLRLAINDETIVDLKNMWLPDFVGAKAHLAADTTYKVTAESGGNTQLFVRVPSDTMAFQSEVGQAVDYYFFYGPEPNQVLQTYREFTGEAPLLPKWAYGFWQCRERYSSQQQILDTAAEFRRRKIPVDVIVQDWQYWGKYGWSAMKFDESAYPDPPAMLSELHRQDFHMAISVWPNFGAQAALSREFENAHLVLTEAARTGAEDNKKEHDNWVDFFNPKAQSAFWSAIDRNLFSVGLDGWWLDASEGDALKKDNTYIGPGRMVLNAFPLFETSAVYNGQRGTTQNKRVVILSRSAYAGQQRNAAISWSGDVHGNWETLRRQIPAGLSFGMSGIPYWTTDIGGFFRPTDQYTSADYHELLIRWFQFGAFCPIFRIHGYQSKTEMWNYGPEVEKTLTQYDELRYRLLPYIYSAAWGVTSRGDTMMQALPFVYPSNLAIRDVDDEFLFGDSLLINPVTQPNATSRSVALPAGDDWVDFWTGQVYGGGQAITVDAPLDRIPILVKEGSILPMGPVVQSTAGVQDPVEIRIYGGKDADFLLYEDSGDGYAYEHGARSTIHFHWDQRRNTLSIGNRSGSFPGIQGKQQFHIALVRRGYGVGSSSDSGMDRSIEYVGRQMTINLGKVAPEITP